MQQGCRSGLVSSLVTKILPRKLEILFDFMQQDCGPSEAGTSNSVLPLPIWTMCGLHSHCYWCHCDIKVRSGTATKQHLATMEYLPLWQLLSNLNWRNTLWRSDYYRTCIHISVLTQAQYKIPYIHWEVIRCKVFPYQIIFNLFSQVDFLVSNTELT